MNIRTRRRIAAGAALSMVATVSAVVLTTSPGSASVTSVTPAAPGNYAPQPTTMKFTLSAPSPTPGGNKPVPVGSNVHWARSGTSDADSFDSTVENNLSPTQSAPETPVDFSDVVDSDTGAGDGPANPGQYDVTFQDFLGTGAATLDSCTGCVTVVAAGPPAVTLATPNKIAAGAPATDVTFTGINFARNSSFAILPLTGNTATDIKVERDTDSGGDPVPAAADGKSYPARVTVPASAALGAHDIQVTNTDGQNSVCTGCFTVLGANLTGVSPPAATNNDTDNAKSITFTGPAGAIASDGVPTLAFVGDPGTNTKESLNIPGTVTSRAADGSSVTATYNLVAAAPGNNAYQPSVQSASGSTVNVCSCRFSITQPGVPTVSSMNPAAQDRGTTQVVTVGGTNFAKGTQVIVAGAGVTTTAVQFVSRTQLKATLSVAAAAAAGKRDVTVKLSDGRISAACTGCYTVNGNTPGSPSATPTATITPSPSASPQGCPSTPVTVRVNTKTINATGLASVTVTGATPSATIELQGYSQNHEGTMTFDNDPTKVDRSGKADNNGSITFSDLRPASNTRLRARQAGCSFGNSDVIEVRAQETLQVTRNGTRTYTFSGRSIPARPGGLIVSLYRITGSACAAGVEPRSCPGETFIGQARAVALGSPGEGLYSIRITFPTRDTNVRDEFVVKTGRDAQNAPGRSNARSLLIY